MAETVNDQFVDTPSRKRKRNIDGLVNEGFLCTTPKKTALRILNDEKLINPINSSGLEVKSISEIIKVKNLGNPYEVVRRPPKKKKKTEREHACFTNPALNLESSETPFNPFEVKRDHVILKNDNNCFTNAGLNIRIPENNSAVNPFEITRKKEIPLKVEGIENPALDMPTTLTLGVPFKPNIDCRIDFTNIPLNSLTPSKLLAEKLVFSPANTKSSTSGRGFCKKLSIISEEAVDIGNELDCYQLELENSINEAKIRKAKITENVNIHNCSVESLILNSFDCNQTKNTSFEVIKDQISNNFIQLENKKLSQEDEISIKITDTIEENLGDSFKIYSVEPSPFVRAYRKPDVPLKENVLKDNKSEPNIKQKFGNVLRKSIRKFIQPTVADNKKGGVENNYHTRNIMNTVRHSFRRKTKQRPVETSKHLHNASIIEEEERQIFRCIENKENILKPLPKTETKLSSRNSFRKSTKEIRNQVLKSVFKKTVEEYELK